MDDDADGSVDVTETDGVRAAAFVCGFVVCSVERLMLQHSALCPMYKQVQTSACLKGHSGFWLAY